MTPQEVHDRIDAECWRKLMKIIGYPREKIGSVQLIWDGENNFAVVRVFSSARDYQSDRGGFEGILNSVPEAQL